MTVATVRLQHVVLAPLIILTLPSRALLGQGLPLTIIIAIAGLTGMTLRRQTLSLSASIGLLAILVWGKAANNILRTAPPDTALLLAGFTGVLTFMEAGAVVSSYSRNYEKLESKNDELSEELRGRLRAWLRTQLTDQVMIASLSILLSILLLPVAGLTGFGNSQLAFSASLALLGVVVLLFLVTHRREPAGP